MIKDLVLKNRSYRRFDETARIARETLVELVELARFSASGANLQPLKYILVHTAEDAARVFPYLLWAGYLKDWDGPAEGERPAAYIIIVGDREVSASTGCDHGIAAQSMLLGAAEKGLGGCMVGAIKKKGLCEELALPERYDPVLVLALGKPAETVVLEDAGAEGNIRYWRDGHGVHHVPKRPLEELIITGGRPGQ